MIKLSSIINSQASLAKLMETPKLPTQISYKLSRLVINFQPELKAYEEARMKLVKDLGEPAKDSPEVNGEAQNWQVKPENITKFTEEMTKLLEVDINLKFSADKEFEKIKLSELGQTDLSANDFINLDYLFVE